MMRTALVASLVILLAIEAAHSATHCRVSKRPLSEVMGQRARRGNEVTTAKRRSFAGCKLKAYDNKT